MAKTEYTKEERDLAGKLSLHSRASLGRQYRGHHGGPLATISIFGLPPFNRSSVAIARSLLARAAKRPEGASAQLASDFNTFSQ